MNNRVPTNYNVTRKQKREMARRLMKKEGLPHKFGNTNIVPSTFSKNWRKYYEQYATEVF